MNTFIANTRIRHNGELYTVGDKIELTDGEVATLPEGAVRALLPITDVSTDIATIDAGSAPTLTADEQAVHDKMVAAVDALGADAFKQDGGIRKGALDQLVADLGFTVTADDVAAIRETKSA